MFVRTPPLSLLVPLTTDPAGESRTPPVPSCSMGSLHGSTVAVGSFTSKRLLVETPLQNGTHP